MGAWDEGRVDDAITALFHATDRDDLFESLWLTAARDHWNLGHKIIHTSAVYRTLGRIGWRHGEPVLRSLALGLLDGPGKGASLAPYVANQKLADNLETPDGGWQRGRADREHSVAVVTALRRAKSADAAGLIAEMLGRGVSAASIWDGYRLLSAEMIWNAPSLLPVHPTTALNALHFAWRTTRRDRTKRLLMLQGASYLPMFRDQLIKRGCQVLKARGIEDFAALQEAAGAADSIGGELLATEDGGGAAFAERLRGWLFAKAGDAHRYKYAAAMLEDSQLCAAGWKTRIRFAGLQYLPTADSRDAAFYRRARVALRRLER